MRVINIVTHISIASLFFFSDVAYCQSNQSVNESADDAKTGLQVGSEIRTDTLERQYVLKEITVTAARLPRVASMIPSSVTVIPGEKIYESNATSLAGIVAPIAGVFVKDYGGMSGLKTISQRGLGTEHTLILLNGMRISSRQNGLVDLGLMPSGQIGSVEVLRGGQSASYGADAVAGVINIVTRAPSEQSVSASNSLGSYGYRRFQVAGGIGSQKNGVRASYGEERSPEDFRFRFHNGSLVNNLSRVNADVVARFGSIQGSVPIAGNARVDGLIWLYSSERGVGGPVVSPFSTSRARETDREHLVQTGIFLDPTEALHFSLQGQVRYSFQRYLDPDLNIGGIPLDTQFKNVDFQVGPKVEFSLGTSSRIAAGVEVGTTTANGSSIRSDAHRTHAGVFTVGEMRLLEGNGIISGLFFQPALRYDATTSLPGSWSPQAGVLVSFREFSAGQLEKMKIGIRTSLSRNFRAPTFNELYYAGGGGYGNPDLRPERSVSFDAGADLSFSALGEHSMHASYFLVTMADRIVWVAAAGGSVTPKNLRTIRSAGVEASYRWSLFSNILAVEANYTLVESRNTSSGDPNQGKQLVYIPQEMLNLSLVATKHFESSIIQQIGGTVTQSFTGYRYMSEDNAVFLPSYRITDIGLRARGLIGQCAIMAKLEVNNLFNEDYQGIIGYPMPLRTYRVTVGVEY